VLLKKPEIIEAILGHHQNFIHTINGLNETEFLSTPPGKWNASQQLDHIHRAVQPVALAFGIPKIFLKVFFGKANRHSKSYDGLVDKYHKKLQEGGKAKGRFIPKSIRSDQRKDWEDKLITNIERLSERIDRYEEQELDYYILPHPLLGKLTLREMLYFTIYHVQHHRALVLRNLELN